MTAHLFSRLLTSRRLTRVAGTSLLALLALSTADVAKSAKAPTVRTAATRSSQPAVKKHWYQIGRASWYGGDFQGRETASGENYNMTDLTCAHRSLPLGTLIRVTNLINHKSVVVRVTDRGPYLASRVIDLSYAAAHFLGFDGIANVRLDILNHATEVANIQSPLPVMGH
jgi:rare lipoprotein A